MVTTESILDIYRRTHAGSERLYRESLRTFPSGVTHDIRYVSPFPIFVERALGSRKWDVDGNEYIDYVMGHGALFLGHAHPEITRAVVEQAGRGTHYGANHRLELEWGDRVKELVPSAEEVRFTSSGTEATLMAVRLARAYTGRDKLLKFDHHFHGWQDDVVGVAGGGVRLTRSRPACPTRHCRTRSACRRTTCRWSRSGSRDGRRGGGDPGADGRVLGNAAGSPGLPAGLRELTRRHNTVLIFDEVVTGFRVSPGGAQARYGVTPDLTTLAKILAGGLPGGAVAGKADILSMIEFRDDAGWNAERGWRIPGRSTRIRFRRRRARRCSRRSRPASTIGTPTR